MDPLITSQSSPDLINQVLIMQPQALNAQNAQGDTPLILATEVRSITLHLYWLEVMFEFLVNVWSNYQLYFNVS